jgi:hypothetical protein
MDLRTDRTAAGTAIVALYISAIALVASVRDVQTEWHGDHFERVGATVILLLFGVVVALILGIVSLVLGWRVGAQKWGCIALTSAALTPVLFVAYVFWWLNAG